MVGSSFVSCLTLWHNLTWGTSRAPRKIATSGTRGPLNRHLAGMKANLALGSAPAMASPSFAAGVASPTSLLGVLLHTCEPVPYCGLLVKKLAGGFDNGLGATLIGERSLALFLSKKSREGISGLFQQYRPTAARPAAAAAAATGPVRATESACGRRCTCGARRESGTTSPSTSRSSCTFTTISSAGT
jgi:hypothetical protein